MREAEYALVELAAEVTRVSMHTGHIDSSWLRLKTRLPFGTWVTGTVVREVPSGALIDLGTGFEARLEVVQIEGMMPEQYRADASCPIGSTIVAMVAQFRDRDRQIALTQKPATQVDDLTARTQEQANAAAAAFLGVEAGAGLAIVEIETFDAGWFHYYDSIRSMATGALENRLIGNAPVFVPRHGGRPVFVRYDRPRAEAIEALLDCGDPNAEPNPEIELCSWHDGALKVSAIELIRACSDLGLAGAKHAVDRCLSGASTSIRTANVATARELAEGLRRLHFGARVTYGDRAASPTRRPHVLDAR